MLPVDALYENGLLRPAHPLDLSPGERVSVIVMRQLESSLWDRERLGAAEADDLETAIGDTDD
ncbi:MAG: antitoxin family protein [Polyangiaceae bacterium]